MVDFPVAFAYSGQDPVNRTLINQDRTLALRSGIPEDLLPLHVTGGIPIQRYLKDLLDRLPHPPNNPAFELVSCEARYDVESIAPDPRFNSSTDSSAYRDAFVDSLLVWVNQHERVKINLDGLDRSCYVWQSILVPPDQTEGSGSPTARGSDASDIDSLERNVLEPNSDDGPDDVPPASSDVPQPPVMFQR